MTREQAIDQLSPTAYFTYDSEEAKAMGRIQTAMNQARHLFGTNTKIVGSEIANMPPPRMDDWQASDFTGANP